MKSKTRIVLLLLVSLLILANCNRFPRDNPIDPANRDDQETDGGVRDGGVPNIDLAEQPTIDDALEYDERNNENGLVEPGETIRFMAELMNTGDETAMGIVATISSTDPCVVSSTVRSTLVARARYGDIEPDRIGPSSEVAGSFYYQVVLSSTECSIGDTVDVSLEVRDDSDNRWSIPLKFEVAENELFIDIVEQIVSDTFPNEPCNEDDEFFEIGETVQMDFRLRNNGSSFARNVQARLLWESIGDCVHFPRGEERKSEWLSFGDIEPGRSKRAEESEGFIVETDVQRCSEGSLNLALEIRDASERFSTQPNKLPVGNIDLRRLDVRLVHDDVDFIDDSTEYSDVNDNHRDADPGELIYLDIGFRNDGRASAHPVQFILDRNEQNLPLCVSEWNIVETPQDPRVYDEIGFGQSVFGWVIEVILSNKNCISGQNIEWIVKAEDRCVGEMTIPVTITID